MASKREEFRKKLEDDYAKTLPGSQAKTSDYYSVNQIPGRFNSPELGSKVDVSTSIMQVNNLGNPVFSCPTFVQNSVSKLEPQDSFKGYGAKQQHPMYMTSAMDYGSQQPTVHTMPRCFHAKSQKFSEHLGKCGMYRNASLNTAVDKSPVTAQLDGLF